MLKPITDKSFKDLTNHTLVNMSFINLFNILEDSETSDKLLNIFRTYSLNEKVLGNTAYFESYEFDNDDWLDNVAYRFYESSYLWWVVAMSNDITNPFEELNEPGDNLKVIRNTYIYQLTKEMKTVAEL